MNRYDIRTEDIDLERVATWLEPGLVLLDLDREHPVLSVAGLLRGVAERIARDHRLDAALLHDALWRREQAGSTALGAGFAVPHARIGGIDHPIVSFVRLERAIPFGADDGTPVSSCLVIMVPRDGADDDHLALLALVARLISDRRFRDLVDRAADAAAARAAFKSGIARLLHG